jgi:hypothetical protein
MAMNAPLSSFDRDLLYQQACKPSEKAPKSDFLIGLSVGQGLQPTGIAVLERFPGDHGSRSYACRYLRRWRFPATRYPVLVSALNEMLEDPRLKGSNLIVEAGPGIRAVVAHLRKKRLRACIQPVELRASADDGYVEGLWRAAKASVIETTRQVMQEDRLIFDDRMPPEVMVNTPSAQTIYHALLNYPYNRTPAANDAFASREGADDDLILAVALACWYGEHCMRELWIL